jgi:hypothetical protein
MNPGLGRNRPGKYSKPATYSTLAGGLAEAEDIQPGEDDPEVDDVEEEEAAAEDDTRNGSPVAEDNAEIGELQVLELHSANPIISYNGQHYSCQWASNVGTELLFMAHDRDSTIPVLRNLHGGVDLLAANSARIISNKLELEPRKRKRSPERAFVRGSNIPHTKYLIPVGVGAAPRRKDQAVFLERLIGMKTEKGETDNVTIVAERRVANSKWKTRFVELRNAERKKLNNIINGKKNAGITEEEVEAAKKRLQAMDEEDHRVSKTEPSLGKRRAAARVGRKKKNVVGAVEGPNPAKPRRGRPPKNLPQEEVHYDGKGELMPPQAEVNEDGQEAEVGREKDGDYDIYSADDA